MASPGLEWRDSGSPKEGSSSWPPFGLHPSDRHAATSASSLVTDWSPARPQGQKTFTSELHCCLRALHVAAQRRPWMRTVLRRPSSVHGVKELSGVGSARTAGFPSLKPRKKMVLPLIIEAVKS